jgi:mono/diheme cytochrome c family protein
VSRVAEQTGLRFRSLTRNPLRKKGVMRKLVRWAVRAVLALVVLSLAAAAFVWLSAGRVVARTWPRGPETVRAATSPDRVAEGARLARVLGCVHCHGEGLRGTRFFDEPNVARLYAPNLTLSAGSASDERLAQAIRQGVLLDGRGAFAMPSDMFATLTDDELGSLLGYLRSLPAGGERTPPLSVGLLGRIGIVTRQFEPAPEIVARARRAEPFDAGKAYATGRHIARIACSECHGADLGGAPPRGDVNATPDLSLATGYPLETFRSFLRTGVAIGERQLPLMSETARARFSRLTDAEIDELYAYLKARADAPPRTAAAR